MLDFYFNMCVFKKVMCMLDLEYVFFNIIILCFDKLGGKFFFDYNISDI